MSHTTPSDRVPFATLVAWFLLGVVLCLCSFLTLNLSSTHRVFAATTSTINFQARLQNPSGTIVGDGYYNVQFKLYGALTGGTALWTESYMDVDGSSATSADDYRVRVQNGYLSVPLGSRTAFPATINWDQQLYLTMNIGGTTVTATPTYDGEMSPRLALGAVPYALRAGQLAKNNGTYSSVLDFNNPTANRSIYLPDESGTLCIQASGNCGFILNSSVQQASSNFSISGNGTVGTNLTVAGATSLQGGLNNNSGGITNSGAISGVSTLTSSNSIKINSSTLYQQFEVNSGVTNDIFGLRINNTGTNGRDWRIEQGRSGTGELNFTDCTASCTSRLTLNAAGNASFTGNVGIGVASPGYTLDIQGTNGALNITNTTNNRSIQISPGGGSVDSVNSALNFNRFSGQVVSVGYSSTSHLRVGQANDNNSFNSTALLYLGNTETTAQNLILARAASQTADILQVRSAYNVTSGDLFNINAAGNVSGSGTLSIGGAITTNAGGAAGTGVQQVATGAYVQSRGENLVANGTGLLGNNYNFSNFVFDPTDTTTGGGSFKNSTYTTTAFTNEQMPVDPTQYYQLSAQLKATTYVSGMQHYVGINSYDIDGLSISSTNTAYQAGTTTTLAQALKPGDTTVYLTSAANWNNAAGAATYNRNIQFWNYTNSKGYTYPSQTYTRNILSDAYADGSVSTGANTITLRTAYSGTYGTIPAGTSLSNGSASGTYKYVAAANQLTQPSWTQYTGVIGGIDYSGTNRNNMFAPGTAFVNVVFLLNRTVTGGTTNVANVSFTNNVSNNFTQYRPVGSYDDSSSYFTVQNSAGSSVLNVDTVANKVSIGGQLAVTSSTLVANLNSQYLNGLSENVLAQNIRASVNLTGGGTVTYNASGLGWTQRFITIANGFGSDFAASGYFNIDMPANGTVITGVGGQANATVASGAIPIGQWNALYYILPVGSSFASQPANFRIASYTATMQVPSNWVLVAASNYDNTTIRLGTGITLRSGQSTTAGSVNNVTFNTSVTTPILQSAANLMIDSGAAGTITIGQNATTMLLGTGTSNETITIGNSTGNDTVNIATSTGTDVVNIGNATANTTDINFNGNTTIKTPGTNSTVAFQVQDAAGNNVFSVDTANKYVFLGSAASPGTQLVFVDNTNPYGAFVAQAVSGGSPTGQLLIGGYSGLAIKSGGTNGGNARLSIDGNGKSSWAIPTADATAFQIGDSSLLYLNIDTASVITSVQSGIFSSQGSNARFQSAKSDYFTTSTFDPAWTFTSGGGAATRSQSTNAGNLTITLPASTASAYDCTATSMGCATYLRPASVDDNVYYLRHNFAPGTVATNSYQGLIVYQDASNWVRYVYVNVGGTLYQRVDYNKAGVLTLGTNSTFTAATSSSYLRINRSGSYYQMTYLPDSGSTNYYYGGGVITGNFSFTWLNPTQYGIIVGKSSTAAVSANFDSMEYYSYPNSTIAGNGLTVRGGSSFVTGNNALDVQSSAGESVFHVSADPAMGAGAHMVFAQRLCVNIPTCNNTLGVFGTIQASGTIGGSNIGTTGNPDIAEMIPAAPDVESGDVVMADPAQSERVIRSTGTGASAVGVIAGATSGFRVNNAHYGAAINNDTLDNVEPDADARPLVIAGRVPVKVTTEGGAIMPGDSLSVSSTTGHAMKATREGETIGKALGFYDGTQTDGKVLALINLSYYNPVTTNMIGSQLAGIQGQLNAMGVSFNTETLTTKELIVTGNANIQGDLTVQGTLRAANVNISGRLELTSGNAPTATIRVAAGADPNGSADGAVSVDGNDNAGTITIVTGSNPSADLLADIAFKNAFSSMPRLNLTALGRSSSALQLYGDRVTAAGFSIGSLNAPAPHTTYTLTYYAL